MDGPEEGHWGQQMQAAGCEMHMALWFKKKKKKKKGEAESIAAWISRRLLERRRLIEASPKQVCVPFHKLFFSRRIHPPPLHTMPQTQAKPRRTLQPCPVSAPTQTHPTDPAAYPSIKGMCSSTQPQHHPCAHLNAGKESLTTLSEKLDLKGQRVFVRVDFNGACFVDMGLVGWVDLSGRADAMGSGSNSNSNSNSKQDSP